MPLPERVRRLGKSLAQMFYCLKAPRDEYDIDDDFFGYPKAEPPEGNNTLKHSRLAAMANADLHEPGSCMRCDQEFVEKWREESGSTFIKLHRKYERNLFPFRFEKLDDRIEEEEIGKGQNSGEGDCSGERKHREEGDDIERQDSEEGEDSGERGERVN